MERIEEAVLVAMQKAAERLQIGIVPITLSLAEIHAITGYINPSKQLAVLRELGVPARQRPDNSVLVMRMHCTRSVALQASVSVPKLKLTRK